jgi:hypothetical protein
LKQLALVFALAVIGMPDAHAYIDPGSGTLLLQMLAASIVGALFYFRAFTTWVRQLFSRLLATFRDRPSTD